MAVPGFYYREVAGKRQDVADLVGINDTQQVEVSKARTVVARGFLEAVARLRQAVTTDDGDAVYIALAEAANWLTSLAEDDAALSADEEAQAVLYARHRTQHQHGSTAYRDEQGGYNWRPASQLPTSRERHHRQLRRRALYVKHLEGQRVEAVFDRLAAKLGATA
jgi:hypothetical protein